MKKNNIANLLCAQTLLILSVSNTNANTVEFNQDALSLLGFSDVNLSIFEKSEFADGKYLVGLYVNGHRINLLDEISFIERNNKVEACLTNTLIAKINLKPEFVNSIPYWQDQPCLDLKSKDENIEERFDDEKQELYLTIPQSYFMYNDDNWVPPQQRDGGVSGLILDYSIIDNYLHYKNGLDSHQLSTYGNVGANLEDWRLRANFQYQKDFKNSNNDHFKWTQIYAFRDLADWSSKLFLGEYYTSSNVFDSVRFKGVSVFSDQSMMPASLRGYAPAITGTALSNATVTISQNGRILSQIKVPAGPFSIDNLSSSLSGALDVKITEEDGSVSEYKVYTTSIPFLTRKGMIQYKFNIGELDPLGNKNIDTKFISNEISWGLSNRTSLYGGLFFTSGHEYQAYNLGLGFNMDEFGAISFDVTKSMDHIQTNYERQGYSYRFNYAKRFSENTQLNLVGYRFSDQGFMSVNNYIDAKSDGFGLADKDKNLLSISLLQQLPALHASASFTLSKVSYWNKPGSTNYNINFNRTIQSGLLKNSQFSTSLAQNSYRDGKKYKQLFVSLSIPLNSVNRSQLQYFGSYNTETKDYNNNLNYYQRVGDNNMILGVSNTNFDRNTGVNAAVYRDTSYGNGQLSGSYNSNYYSFSGAFNGSLTITKQGPVLHKKVYPNQSRMIIDMEKADNVSVDNNAAISNRFGLAGLSNVPTYYRSLHYIDLNNMPENVSIDDNVISSVLTDGAIGYTKVSSIIGEKILTTIKLSNGKYPPFGAFAFDKNNNQDLGMVSEDGYIYLTGITNNKDIIVKWDNDQSCHIKINTSDVKTLKNLVCYQD